MKKIAIGLLMLSQFAFAQNKLQLIKEQNHDASAYEILEMFYNQAPQAAQISDFDTIDYDQSNQHCVVTSNGTKDENLNRIIIRQTSKTYSSHGPLIPTRTVSKLDWTNTYYFKKGIFTTSAMISFDHITMDENIYDLTMHTDYHSYWLKDHQFNVPESDLFMRKDENVISFKLVEQKITPNGPLLEKESTYFGYCWRDSLGAKELNDKCTSPHL